MPQHRMLVSWLVHYYYDAHRTALGAGHVEEPPGIVQDIVSSSKQAQCECVGCITVDERDGLAGDHTRLGL